MPDILNARCTAAGCGHVWIAGPWLPSLALIAQLLQTLRCPKCDHHAPAIGGPTMDEGEPQHA